MYDEITYWNARKDPNSPAVGAFNDRHLFYIKTHLDGCSSVLDFGPGVGRTFPAYVKIKKLFCFDITDKHTKKLALLSDNYNFDFDFKVSDKVGETGFEDNLFDAVVVSQVLLHQRPSNIEGVMSELLRVSRKVIVITWRDNSKPDSATSGEHCFNHNYLKICKINDWQHSNVEYYGKDIYFIYKEK